MWRADPDGWLPLPERSSWLPRRSTTSTTTSSLQLVHQHHRHQNHHHQHRKAGCQRRPASATTPTHTKVSSLQSGWLGNVEFYKRISFSSGWLPCRPTSSTTLNPFVAPNSFLIDISPRLVRRIFLMYLICSVCLHLVFNPLNPFQGWVY